MLDIEYNPSGATCYGLSASAMVSWIKSFVDTYHTKTGRYPIIYTTNDWWQTVSTVLLRNEYVLTCCSAREIVRLSRIRVR